MNGTARWVAPLCLATAAGCPQPVAPDAATEEAWARLGGYAGSVAPGELQALSVGRAHSGQHWRILRSDEDAALMNIAIFDRDTLLVRRTYQGGSAFEHTLQRDSDDLRVVITPATDAAASVAVEAQLGAASGQPAPPAPQAVYLQFNGAVDVRIDDEPGLTLPPFDAGRIAAQYADTTPRVRASIIRTMEACFAGFAVTFVASGDGPPPAGPYSTLYFGGSHEVLLGLADSVDRFNTDRADDAIVYTDSFSIYADMGFSPEELGRLIGNTAAHELGHLMGLYHTQGVAGMMDTSAGILDLLHPRQVTRDPVARDVFPTGIEDGPRMLVDALGPALAEQPEPALPAATARPRAVPAALPAPPLAACRSGCGG